MKPYRLKHTATGLYFTPVKGNSKYMTNLSKTGKIYMTRINGMTDEKHRIIYVSESLYRKMKDVFDELGATRRHNHEYAPYEIWCSEADFETEPIE